jgi:hypothetical protein
MPNALRLALLIVPFAVPTLAADIPSSYAPTHKAPAGQCQGFFGQPITDDLLPAMHDAGCCDVLVSMLETASVNALERRLHCPAWHHYTANFDSPPGSLETLSGIDVPDEIVNAVIPNDPNGSTPLPIPVVAMTPAQSQIVAPPRPQQLVPPTPTVVPQRVPTPSLPPQRTPPPPTPAETIPWTTMTSPAEFPEGVTPPPSYAPGPLNFGG